MNNSIIILVFYLFNIFFFILNSTFKWFYLLEYYDITILLLLKPHS